MTISNGNLDFELGTVFCIQVVAVLLKAQFLPSVTSLESVSVNRIMMVPGVTGAV